MASLLRTLSAACIVAGLGAGACLLLEEKDRSYVSAEAMKLRPSLDKLIDQGKTALRGIVAETNSVAVKDPSPEANDAKLPFIVIEPREFGAPSIRMPAAPKLAGAEQPEAAEQVPDLRLTQGEGALAMDLNPVEARLRAKVPAELIGYFDLFLYVSKATTDKGDWAQRMFVLAKDKTQPQTFALIHHWSVSTGREEPMTAPSGRTLGTNTPQGIFKLDRDRFYEDYNSREWQAPMPYAMFFDWQVDGRTSGLAIHGTDEEGQKSLGQRASHGCIRLAPDNARVLFELIQNNYRGRVPEFRVDADSGTMSTTGALARDEDGKVRMTSGYKVLVFIEDYGGPSVDTVAALY